MGGEKGRAWVGKTRPSKSDAGTGERIGNRHVHAPKGCCAQKKTGQEPLFGLEGVARSTLAGRGYSQTHHGKSMLLKNAQACVLCGKKTGATKFIQTKD